MKKFLQRIRFKTLYLTKMFAIIKEEFLNIYYSYKVREASVDKTFSRQNALHIKIRRAIKCLHPMSLNMTKRSRLIVESLELKGVRYEDF